LVITKLNERLSGYLATALQHLSRSHKLGALQGGQGTAGSAGTGSEDFRGHFNFWGDEEKQMTGEELQVKALYWVAD
jgi:hypothetical protein